MAFDTLLTAKIVKEACQVAISMVSSVKKSNDMQRIIEDIQDISKDICTMNKKLDTLIEMGQDQVLGRLRAANKKLATCIAAKAFTSLDIQTIEELYLPNTGLSKNGKTGAYSNSQIIAYSWWGLILLELQTGADVIKLARYIVEMFDADYLLAKETFPEICQEFYQPFIDEYNDEECRCITWLSSLDIQSLADLLTNKNSWEIANAKDIAALLDFYGWDQESRKVTDVMRRHMAVGAMGVVGAVGMLMGAVEASRLKMVSALAIGAAGMAAVSVVLVNEEAQSTAFEVKSRLKHIVSCQMNDPKYQDKRRRIVINILTNSYLDALRR